jgi:methionyl aminopeptidase
MGLIKSRGEIDLMKESGRIVAKTLRVVSAKIAPGVTPKELNDLADQHIRSEGGVPSFLNYRGFPAAACISVNSIVVHGIPSNIPLEEGDVCSLDFGVVKNGWHADGAWTYPVGKISVEAERLMKVTREALNQGIAKARPGNRIGDISATIQRYCESNGYGVVRDLVGHGIGQALHEAPHAIPNFGRAGKGDLLREGMTICIEPMINQGTYKVIQWPDQWTIETADKKLSAHFEHTIAISRDGAEIVTQE